MYGQYLTEKVQAKRAGETIERLVLDESTYRSMRRDRIVSKKTGENEPVRFGLAGDFEVIEGDTNMLVTDVAEHEL